MPFEPGVPLEHYLLHALLVTFPFLLLSWLLPALVYSVFRIPVLDELWESWPPFSTPWLKPWFQGIPQIGYGSARSNCRHRVCAYIPPISTHWDAVYWSPRGNPQKTLLKAAIAYFYRDTTEEGRAPTIWHEQAFGRWLVFWLTPIWGGYIALLLLLPLASFSGVLCQPAVKVGLYAAIWVWMVYGVFYVRNESAELLRWGTRRPNDYRYMPPVLGAQLKTLSPVALKLTSVHVTAVFRLINLVGIVAYLSFFRTLCH